jgi:hypothetical protein
MSSAEYIAICGEPMSTFGIVILSACMIGLGILISAIYRGW